MTNSFMLVGRLITDIEKINENNIILNIGVNKPDEDGEEIIPVSLYGNIAKATLEHCEKGCIVGMHGTIKNKDGIELVVDKITFLSSKKEGE